MRRIMAAPLSPNLGPTRGFTPLGLAPAGERAIYAIGVRLQYLRAIEQHYRERNIMSIQSNFRMSTPARQGNQQLADKFGKLNGHLPQANGLRQPFAKAMAFHASVTGDNGAHHGFDWSKISVENLVTADQQEQENMSNTEALELSLVNGGSPELKLLRAFVGFIDEKALNTLDGLILEGLRSQAGDADSTGDVDGTDDVNPDDVNPDDINPDTVNPDGEETVETGPSDEAILAADITNPAIADIPDVTLFDSTGVPTANDIRQNAMGDCYLAAPLMALAETHPELIQNAIKDNGDGTFTVTLNEAVEAEKGDPGAFPDPYYGGYSVVKQREIIVTQDEIKANILAQGGSSIDSGDYSEWDISGQQSGAATSTGAAWPAVIEVAYAKLNTPEGGTLADGYENIINGGMPSNAFFALTGTYGREVRLSAAMSHGDTVDTIAEKIKAQIDAGVPMVLGTLPEVGEIGRSGQTLSEFSVGQQDGLIDNHAYQVVDVTAITDPDSGVTTQYMVVRNPFNFNEMGMDGEFTGYGSATDGLLYIPLEDILAGGNDLLFINDKNPASGETADTSTVSRRAPQVAPGSVASARTAANQPFNFTSPATPFPAADASRWQHALAA